MKKFLHIAIVVMSFSYRNSVCAEEMAPVRTTEEMQHTHEEASSSLEAKHHSELVNVEQMRLDDHKAIHQGKDAVILSHTPGDKEAAHQAVDVAYDHQVNHLANFHAQERQELSQVQQQEKAKATGSSAALGDAVDQLSTQSINDRASADQREVQQKDPESTKFQSISYCKI